MSVKLRLLIMALQRQLHIVDQPTMMEQYIKTRIITQQIMEYKLRYDAINAFRHREMREVEEFLTQL